MSRRPSRVRLRNLHTVEAMSQTSQKSFEGRGIAQHTTLWVGRPNSTHTYEYIEARKDASTHQFWRHETTSPLHIDSILSFTYYESTAEEGLIE